MKRKVVYNRWKVPSEEIQKQQDFDSILKGLKKDSTGYWKSIGFWGTVGTSAVALFFVISQF
ncbi:hypothetical protein [Brumimicrobium oceani]|uniref:Uncharacterized protein n=1 Tax=Brumimicrobium oceani TaxID=2100725 RepID=A0A2U2XEY4_9FLAO|nr:hypothetical protein [Brumimicrobium oceani]PWH86366.1 hypothetical protein DIT68_03755 [Brumimicrobium oceani]